MNFVGRFLINNSLRSSVTQFRSIYSCWSCGKDATSLVSNLFCPNCKSLQRPDKKDNYFSIIGVKETFDIDPNDLAKKYKDLQKFLHPDKFASRDSKELEISEIYSSLVNEAYKTLLEPLSRGIYMLKLRGFEIQEKTELGNEFLMEVMEINEQVEEAETEDEIMKLNKNNIKIINELQRQLSGAFFDGDMKRVQQLLSRLKYYTSIDNQIQAVIRQKGIIR